MQLPSCRTRVSAGRRRRSHHGPLIDRLIYYRGRGKLERLEERALLATFSSTFDIEFDYQFADFRFDPANPDGQTRRDILEAAAGFWERSIADEFENVPAGTTISVEDPSTGMQTDVLLTSEIDDLRIYVGSRDLNFTDAGGNLVVPAAEAGPASVDASRDTSADFEPWAGTLIFNSSRVDFYLDPRSTQDILNDPFGVAIPAGTDFLSVSIHEIGHILGVLLGTDAFREHRVTSGTTRFTGEIAKRYNNGMDIPLDVSHVAGSNDGEVMGSPGITSVMVPQFDQGVRVIPSNLDFGILGDIGYSFVLNDRAFFQGTTAKDEIRFESPTPTTVVVRSENDSGKVRTLNTDNPTTELIISGGDGDDTVTVQPLDPAFAATVTLDGGPDNDKLTVDSSQAVTLTDAQLTIGTQMFSVSAIEAAVLSGTSVNAAAFTGAVATGQADFVSQGPGSSTGGTLTGIPGRPQTGAIEVVSPHPTNPKIVYVGAVGGGVFKTENALDGNNGTDDDGDGLIDELDEVVWEPLTEQLPTPAISTLVFDPTDPSGQTLFAGTGNVSSANVKNFLSGLFKTTDGGKKWSVITSQGITKQDVFAIDRQQVDDRHRQRGVGRNRRTTNRCHAPEGRPVEKRGWRKVVRADFRAWSRRTRQRL